MGVKRTVWTSGLQPDVMQEDFGGLKHNFCQNTHFQNFPLYFLGIPLYNVKAGRRVDFDSMIYFLVISYCTHVQNIHGIGKILKRRTWEIFAHPNLSALGCLTHRDLFEADFN